MFNRTVFGGAALACWGAALAADVARAQQPPAPVPVQQAVPDAVNPAPAPQAHRVKSVLGTKVSIQGNLAIGTVDDIIFDDNGYIDYLVVLNEGKSVVVPWQAAKFNFEQRAATVNITEQQFRQVPTYTTTQVWPNLFEPAYRQRIYTYYGLTPGQERRIERREGIRRP